MTPAHLDQLVETLVYETLIVSNGATPPGRGGSGSGRLPPLSAAPPSALEPPAIQTELLFHALDNSGTLSVEVRFLQALEREVGVLEEPLTAWISRGDDPSYRVIPAGDDQDPPQPTWQETAERRVAIELKATPGEQWVPFRFETEDTIEPIFGTDGGIPAVLVRRGAVVRGVIRAAVLPAADGRRRLSVRIENTSDVPAGAGPRDLRLLTLLATHTVVQATAATLLSVNAPPLGAETDVAACRNVGAWPVLVGDPASGICDTVLSSPFALADYPPETPPEPPPLLGATEVEELLTLRMLTVPESSCRALQLLAARAQGVLERTEALPADQLAHLHGVIQRKAAEGNNEPAAQRPLTLETAQVEGREVRAGDTVTIRPPVRAGMAQPALAGRRAVIDAIELDAMGTIRLALVVEDRLEPDRIRLRRTGHRFFYRLDEVEAPRPRGHQP